MCTWLHRFKHWLLSMPMDDYYCHATLLRDFHTNISRWFLTQVWVTASLQDSSEYSGRSEQYFSLVGLYLSCYFQELHHPYQSFGDCTESTSYHRYHPHYHIGQFFFHFPGKVQVLIPLLTFFRFYSGILEFAILFRFWQTI